MICPDRSFPVLMIFALWGAATAAAQVRDDHLFPLPRTEDEASRTVAVTRAATDFSVPEPFEDLPAGAATIPARDDADAFSQPSANMEFERELDFQLGKALFEKLWVSAPSSTKASDGLGPLFNARACQSCHIRDGRGHPPEGPDDSALSMVARVSLPSGAGTYRPHPVYGRQVQEFGLPGHASEGRLTVAYTEEIITLSGGETARLQIPAYEIHGPGHGQLSPETVLSPRIAPPMIGLGLLEAIPTGEILSAADPDDLDGDAISGRAPLVWSDDQQRMMPGRFGWRSEIATLIDQTASAFAMDIGISTPLLPDPWGDCSIVQRGCRSAPHGDGDEREQELDREALELVTFYGRNLAVPAREAIGDPQVLRGKAVFYETGCIACHTPKFVTHRLPGQPEQSFQLIWPYSDLLLHDMGPGLADRDLSGNIASTEWRTAPLWGIGRTGQVSDHTRFLHDGRARSLLEAVLWHGGEAAPHRATVIAMPPTDRAALIRFLESL
ncbi:di-heme oxidoredictase family protein [Primorskyibacter sp. S87]|uniref:di-heme oxidoreductase family protein n=1 Tax=Primorskyibacter sp. S87 TaxID=3415126 RepID=UPI003C79E00C